MARPLTTTGEDIFSKCPGFGCIVRPDDGAPLAEGDVVALLGRRGAVLLRKAAASADSFVDLVTRLFGPPSSYDGGALDRTAIPGHHSLFSTTGADQRFGVPLHGEMYYTDTPPRVLCFYCRTPPVRGGQTTLCDGVAAAERLEGRIADFFRANGLKYFRTTQAGSSEHVCSAFVTTPGGPAFINNVLPVFADELNRNGMRADGSGGAPSLVVRTATGARLPLDLVLEIRNALERITIDVEWDEGDVLLVDNGRAMHGRRRLIEGNREIYVQLIA